MFPKRVAVACGALLFGLCPTAARSDAPARIDLSFASGDPSCIDSAALAGAIERAVARPVFHGSGHAAAEVSGWAERSGPTGYAAHVELRTADGKLLAERTLRTEGECHALDAELSVATTLMLGNLLGTGSPLQLPAEPPPSATPTLAPLLLHPPAPHFSLPSPMVISHDADAGGDEEAVDAGAGRDADASSVPVQENTGATDASVDAPEPVTPFAIGLGAVISSGVLPKMTLGAAGHGEISLFRNVPFAGTIRSYGPQTVAAAHAASFRFSGFSLDVTACPTLVSPNRRIGVCAGLGAGKLSGSATVAGGPTAPAGPLFFATLAPSLAMRATGSIWLRVEAGLQVALARQSWTSLDSSKAQVVVVEPSNVAPFAGVSVEFRGGAD